MSKISKSPDRHTFQKNAYLERCQEKGEDPLPEYLDMYDSAMKRDEENLANPEWHKNNLEYDLRTTDWILDKVRTNEAYAQNLYAALCNNDFQKLEVITILQEKTWSCSWRYAGGIIADMREEGDYIDWYCSGIRGDILTEDEVEALSPEQLAMYEITRHFVGEGYVTDEIKQDLIKLGWIVVDSEE